MRKITQVVLLLSLLFLAKSAVYTLGPGQSGNLQAGGVTYPEIHNAEYEALKSENQKALALLKTVVSETVKAKEGFSSRNKARSQNSPSTLPYVTTQPLPLEAKGNNVPSEKQTQLHFSESTNQNLDSKDQPVYSSELSQIPLAVRPPPISELYEPAQEPLTVEQEVSSLVRPTLPPASKDTPKDNQPAETSEKSQESTSPKVVDKDKEEAKLKEGKISDKDNGNQSKDSLGKNKDGNKEAQERKTKDGEKESDKEKEGGKLSKGENNQKSSPLRGTVAPVPGMKVPQFAQREPTSRVTVGQPQPRESPLPGQKTTSISPVPGMKVSPALMSSTSAIPTATESTSITGHIITKGKNSTMKPLASLQHEELHSQN